VETRRASSALLRALPLLALGVLAGSDAGAQQPPSATAPNPPASPPQPPPCSHCKAALQTVDALRAKLPSAWAVALEPEPVFRGEMLVVQAGRANAQTLLLVHGLGQNGFTDWLPVLPQLARTYHVVAVDLPGYGYSSSPPGKYSPRNYARVLEGVLARHAKGPAIVVGHSMGGAVALRLAADHPATTRKLVLVDVAGVLHRTAFVKHSATDPFPTDGLPEVLRDPVTRLKDLGRAAVEHLFGLPNDPTRVLRQSDLAWELALRNRTNVNAALALVDEDFSSAIHTLRQPTHIIWGEADTITPMRTAQVLARRVPSAQLRTMAGVGHAPMETAPDHFLALLHEALASDPPAAPARAKPPREAGDLDLACTGRVDRQFGGYYRNITLKGCNGVRLADLSAERVVIRDSIVQMQNVQIRGAEVALDVSNSEILVTASDVSGEIAIRADASRLDLAGVALLALDTAVEVKRRSRLIASVSEIRSPEYNGYWHDSVELEETRLNPARARP
jgi:pimeloyl-ACP methyl ester carboxylesterase